MKNIIVVLMLFSLNINGVFSQKSPVKFLNNTWNINVDTTSYGKKIVYTDLIDLKYKFVNTGKHVTFIETKDTEYYGGKLPYCITKPKDTSTLVLKFEKFFNPLNNQSLRIQKDTSSFINIPFYYEGKMYYEKLTLSYTFWESKLIEYDNTLIQVNDTISKFFIDDNHNDTITKQYPRINFILYYSVKNITNVPIWCTESLTGYNDTNIKDHKDIVIIPPHTTYKIAITMNMYNKYKFTKGGRFIVFSEDVFEVHQIIVKSDFEPKGKYKFNECSY